jgi:aspartate/methionine/tyrosine aminotransferase
MNHSDQNYLSWFKDLYQDIWHREDVFSLLSSNVSEPTKLLQDLVENNRDRMSELLNMSNEWGHPALLEAIADKQKLLPENITLSNGASNGISLVCQALLKRDDRVIIEHPVYQPLEIAARSVGAEVTWLERKAPGYRIDLNAFAGLVDKNTKLVILTNLHNPSASFIDRVELLKIADIAKAANPDIKILVDEIYGDFVGKDFPYAAALDECFITISSFSKVYGLSLLRCGWIAADRMTTKIIREQWAKTEGCGSRLLESISVLVFEDLGTFLERTRKIVDENRILVKESLAPLIERRILKGDIPEYGCIYFPEIGHIKDTADYLKEKHSIYTVPGDFFGKPECIRIGFGGEKGKLSASLEKLVGALNL